jgi:FKBP-type peptidyl-prolyl cis-trans isomerase FklB
MPFAVGIADMIYVLIFAPHFNHMKQFQKSTIILAAVILSAFIWLNTGCTGSNSKPVKVKMENEKDSASYALGAQIGGSIKKDGFDSLLTMDIFLAGIKNGLLGEVEMTDEEKMAIIQRYMDKEMERKSAAMREKGEQFLAENKKKPGINTTASGLQYEVLAEGSGTKPAATNTVIVHYTGSLLSGDVFDSSEGMDPIEFQLDKVIRGWTEGIQLMSVGAKYKFYIPSDLGYGPMGQPQAGIGPHEVLVFVVELLGIK